MDIRKLESLFYEENVHLKEVLDKTGNVWVGDKTRGYGIAVITLNGLTFGIPLRSNIPHKFHFLTKKNHQQKTTKGLDYSKAVLLSNPAYISTVPFNIPSDEFSLIQSYSRQIQSEFEVYVMKYIEAVSSADQNKLRNYKFSTLQNYHQELGL